MIWTYKLRDDGKSHDPAPVRDAEAVKEWLKTAMFTRRNEQPYLDPLFGLDIVTIIRGKDPACYLEQNIKEICSMRKDVTLTSCKCWKNGRKLFATVTCKTIYGEITLEQLKIFDGEGA
ncbi:MAG: hypothetical protein MJ014_00075 [Methanocorpusculum sp.]|nr:hypothetical protein [Methanocorpusculum sp.]